MLPRSTYMYLMHEGSYVCDHAVIGDGIASFLEGTLQKT